MRKTLVLALCVALLAPLAFAQTNVLSQNAVGYVKVTADRDAFALVRNDFYDIDGNPTLPEDVLGAQLPFNTSVLVWNGMEFEEEKYLAATKTTPEGWAPNTHVLAPGVGFFINVPASAPAASYDVYLLGEVPAVATTDVTLAEQFTLTGYPYPASVSFTNTAMATGPNFNDTLFTWNGAGYDENKYLAATKTTPEGWSNPTQEIVPGEGFFFQNVGTARIASEAKPYAWP